MHINRDLRNMTFKQALVLAKLESGLHVIDLVEITGIGHATLARYFKEHDHYYPAPHHIPILCEAMGNTIVADWVAENSRVLPVHDEPIASVAQLLEESARIGEAHGAFWESVVRAIDDGVLDPDEARELNATLADIESRARSVRAKLQALAERRR